MGWKETAAGYFTFSRKDRIGVLVLIGLIALVYALPYLAPANKETPVPLDAALMISVDSLKQNAPPDYAAREETQDYVFEPSSNVASAPAALFIFDPNTLDAAGWRKLGLREKTIKTIYNYRNKGGKFYKPEDLAKIWGLPGGFYERVKGHIRIAQPLRQYERPAYAEPPKTFVARAPAIININQADTTGLIALPGIGSKLAGRIIAFRDKLGGFAAVAQVGETYGLPDSTFQKIKGRLTADAADIKKININTATKEELSAHPYIKWKIATAVVAYREQHGAFASVDDLRKIMILDDAAFEKIKPYVSLR